MVTEIGDLTPEVVRRLEGAIEARLIVRFHHNDDPRHVSTPSEFDM